VSDRVVRGTNDPAYVSAQYATESGLAARKSVYRDVAGVDARDVAFRLVATARPQLILEVGCGEGELAARLQEELAVDVTAVDQSTRMVELTRERGVNALVADVQELPFDDEAFDAVVAAWMLYHVADIDRALAEISRVLRPGGRLVAVTNRADHLAELFALAGIERWELPFGAENGAQLLSRHFEVVDVVDADGTVVFADIAMVRSYFESSDRLSAYLDRLPDRLDEPLVVRRRPIVFVAEKAA
jgi:SAM-dependent methyltransferase